MIVWDEPKRIANRSKHGFDFADLDPSFFDDAVIIRVKLGRAMAIGPFRETVIAVVFQRMGIESISIISMRPASRKEREL